MNALIPQRQFAHSALFHETIFLRSATPRYFEPTRIQQCTQEAQLMLTNPHDTMFYVNRISAYLEPFSR